MSPAEAAGTGAVSGTVRSNPGVPLAPLVTTNSSVTFSSTAIVGAIEVGTCAYAGTINVTAAASATDNNTHGTGTITALSGSGSTAPTSISVSRAAAATAGVENTFVRVGTNVTVLLALNVTISGPTGTCSARVTAAVDAEFVPTVTNGTHATEALFVGSFSTAP